MAVVVAGARVSDGGVVDAGIMLDICDSDS